MTKPSSNICASTRSSRRKPSTMHVPKSAKGFQRRLPGRETRRARRTGLVLLALFVVLAGGLAAFFWWADRSSARLGADLCPDDADFRPPRLVVVLFDQTDP